MDNRATKLAKLRKPKGKTIIGRAKDHAIYMPSPKRFLMLRGKKNQRQKRKLWRNAPHMRK